MQSFIEIDTKKIVENYALAKKTVSANCNVAAVVKANAYGLGAKNIAQKLFEAGCRTFYVAYLDEYMDIKPVIGDSKCYVLMLGCDEIKDAIELGAIPVIYTKEMLECMPKGSSCVVHIDTGMNRQGIAFKNVETLDLDLYNVEYIMSHLACSDDAENPMNEEQLGKVGYLKAHFKRPISFCNSDGIFLGSRYHLAQVRPGCMLYGVGAGKDRGIRNPLRWCANVLQIANLDAGETVSYCARYRTGDNTRIATVACGYADGYKRILTNNAFGYFKGYKLPQVGTVTMDMIMFDVSSVPENILSEMNFIELLNDSLLIDDLAISCNTIGYEIITSLGNRIKRVYK